MFNSEELLLISYSLTAMKDLCEADLFITTDKEFLSQVESDIAQIDALQDKVKNLMGQFDP